MRIPANRSTNPNPFNVLQNNPRHELLGAQTARIINLTSPHRKGRKASDQCGGGGRSSGDRRAGVTRAVRGLPSLGSPPAVGVERGSARDLPKARALVVRDLLETADPGSG